MPVDTYKNPDSVASVEDAMVVVAVTWKAIPMVPLVTVALTSPAESVLTVHVATGVTHVDPLCMVGPPATLSSKAKVTG